MRRLVILFTGLAILGLVNYSIHQKEQLLSTGRKVYFQLAPIDPRSLMQGDYMALRFGLEREIPWSEDLQDRLLVVTLDKQSVAHFARFDDGHLNPDELVLRLRVREGRPQIGPGAFFFEEGDAKYYASARYAEARASNGDVIVVALCGENLDRLGPPPPLLRP